MPTPNQPKGEVSLRVVPPSRDERVPVVTANFFNLSFFGSEVQLDAQFIDLHDLARATRGEKFNLVADPVFRLAMSVSTFALLKHQVDTITQKMRQAGIELDRVSTIAGTPS